jgi:uncharacterized protein
MDPRGGRMTTTIPGEPPVARDLDDAEWDALDALLADTPEPLEPLDIVMLDGYLCGVIVQPVALEAAAWLPHVFDLEGAGLPEAVDPDWQRQVTALVMRRHAALTRSMVEDGGFDPVVFERPDDTGAEIEDTGWAELAPASRALAPWVAGFEHATACFPDLVELEDDEVQAALDRIFRHLPAETDDERTQRAALDREAPVGSLDAAIDELVGDVADIEARTRDLRYQVETVRREGPKVGRNDPCPCGSGRKFKHCHGSG